MQVSRTAITSDVQYLREQAKGTIKEYVTEHLPEQYQINLSAEFLHSLEVSEAARANLELLVTVGPITSNYYLFHHE